MMSWKSTSGKTACCITCPYYDQDDDRFPEYRPIDNGKVLLHGHVHERWLTNGKQINVGVDVWDYAPVSEQQVRNLLKNIDYDSL